MVKLLGRFPLLLPVLGLGTGIFLAGLYPWSASIRIGVGVLALVSLLFGIVSQRAARFRWGFLFLFFLGLGMVRIGNHFFSPLPPPLRNWIAQRDWHPVLIQSGEWCRRKGPGGQWKGRVLGYYHGDQFVPVNWQVQFWVPDSQCRVQPGETYRTLATFRQPRKFKNPSSFDYPHYLRAKGILANAYLKGDDWLVPRGPDIPPYRRGIQKLRGKLEQGLREIGLERGPRGVFEALLLRNRGQLPLEVEEGFRRAGISHLLAVSGLHFGMVFSIFYFCGYFLLSFSRSGSNLGWARRLAFVLALIPTYVFAECVGFNPSVSRAFFVCVLSAFLLLGSIKKNYLSLILFVAFLLLLWDPPVLFDLSFQFTFLSVTTLYFFSRPLQNYFKSLGQKNRVFKYSPARWVLLMMGTAVAINLVLFPLMSRTFHEVSLLAPIANLFYVPWVTFVLLPGLLVSSSIYFLEAGWGGFLFRILGEGTEISLSILEGVAKIPGAAINVSSLSFWGWLTYLCGLGTLFSLPNKKRWMVFLLSAFLFLGLGILSEKLREPEKILKLSLLDVGQGDSILLELPSGGALLIDGGGFSGSDFDIGRAVVVPELLDRGIRRLHAMIMTHPDADHYKGLKTVLERIPTGEFWVAPSALNSSKVGNLLSLAKKRGVPVSVKSQGWEKNIEGVQFQILWPPAGMNDRGESGSGSDNDQSLVLRICYREICFLLTGDIESEAEARLRDENLFLSAPILKAAHHGSRTSSTLEFLRAVQPKLVLVSAGERNRFGFPHHEVLERFAQLGFRVLQTGLHGQIQVETDGRNVIYRSYSGEEGEIILQTFPSR